MKVSILISSLVAIFVCVSGHGRLWEPPGRATLWRDPRFRHLNPPQDYNDNQCFCGGVWVQYGENNGKCGICGDPWNEAEPRAHEDGGTFAKGIITGNYTAGQVFDVSVELTAAHLGYFEFRLCARDDPNEVVTQECLDRNLLQLADDSGTKYPIPTKVSGWHNYQLKLPQGVKCSRCVLQWHYRVGNSHGYCEDGSYQLGCGDQETFRGCADITIS